jgi:hypothetical protein
MNRQKQPVQTDRQVDKNNESHELMTGNNQSVHGGWHKMPCPPQGHATLDFNMGRQGWYH